MEHKKIIVHCAGGAGISIADKTFKFLSESNSKYKAQLVYHCLDTSDANYKDTKHLKEETELYKITNMSLSQGYLDGSGGIRSHAAPSVVKGVQEYLDKNKYLTPKRGEIHVILASASGGSGNVIASMLLSNLMGKEIPTFLILIGDGSNAKATENTRKTLLTISGIANNLPRVVSLRYLFNNYAEFNTLKEAQADNDAQIAIMLDFLRIFNGDVKDLDYQDLLNLINPKAEDFDLNRGIYSLISKIGVSDKDNLDSLLIPVINRTIIQDPANYKALDIMHSKVGYIENKDLQDNVEAIHGLNNLTLSLVAGGLQEELNALEDTENRIKKNLEKSKEAIKIKNNITPDDNGIVF